MRQTSSPSLSSNSMTFFGAAAALRLTMGLTSSSTSLAFSFSFAGAGAAFLGASIALRFRAAALMGLNSSSEPDAFPCPIDLRVRRTACLRLTFLPFASFDAFSSNSMESFYSPTLLVNKTPLILSNTYLPLLQEHVQIGVPQILR